MQSNHFSDSKTTTWHRIQSILFAISIITLIIAVIWWYMDSDFETKKKEILSNPIFSKGLIIAKRTYKGKGADIEYFANGVKYKLKTGITTEFYKKTQIGDSVDVVYSKKNPKTALLRYEIMDLK